MARQRKARPDWLFFCDGSHPEHPWSFWCSRCGAAEQLPSPIAITVYSAWLDDFRERHRGCQEPAKVDAWGSV
jgi:hypothetical protein